MSFGLMSLCLLLGFGCYCLLNQTKGPLIYKHSSLKQIAYLQVKFNTKIATVIKNKIILNLYSIFIFYNILKLLLRMKQYS